MFEGLRTYRTDKNTGHSYEPVYRELLAGRNVERVLEIGVFWGDSLRMWRDYLDCDVVGIENKRSRAICEDRITTVVGSQGDPSVLREAGRLGPYDLIVDDGSHKACHQLTSILYLWEFLRPGGVYVIEDLQEPEKWLALMPSHVVDLRAVKGIYDDALLVVEKT